MVPDKAALVKTLTHEYSAAFTVQESSGSCSVTVIKMY